MTFPGLDGNNLGGTIYDLALFSFNTSATRSVGLDFSTTTGTGLNGSLSLGAIEYLLSSTSGSTLTFGNNSASNGVLTLNGSTIGGFSDVILANLSTSSSTNLLSIDQNVTPGTGTLSLFLTNPNSTILTSNSLNTVTLNVPVGGSASAGLKIEGPGIVNLNGAVNLSGGMTINGGVNFGAAVNLSGGMTINGGVIFRAPVNSSGGMTINGGSVILNPGSSWAGSNITINAGTLTSNFGNTDPIANATNIFVNSGGTFELAIFNDTIAGLSLSGLGQSNRSALRAGLSGGNVTGTLTVTSGVSLTGNTTVGGGSGIITLDGAISGAFSLSKVGQARIVLTTSNTYSGETAVFEGVLQANSPSSLPGTGKTITVAPGGGLAAGYAIDQSFLNRLSNASGSVLLAASSSQSLDFSTIGPVSLGAANGATYSGAITPFANVYRFGAIGSNTPGTLTVTAPLSGANSVLISNNNASATGFVTLSGSKSYTGPTRIAAGMTLITSSLANGGSPSAIGASSADASNLIVNGGRFDYQGTTSVVTDRGVTISGNAYFNAASSNVTLQFTGDLVRSDGATLVVPYHPNAIVTPTDSKVAFATVNGSPFSSATINGVIPWSTTPGFFNTVSFTGFLRVLTFYTETETVPLSSSFATDNVDATSAASVANRTITTNQTINSLIIYSTSIFVNGSGTTLTLGSGGLIFSDDSPANGLIRGSATDRVANAGRLTSGNPSGDLYVTAMFTNTLRTATISTAIVDNGATPVRLVFSGTKLILEGNNTLSGGAMINTGIVVVAAGSSLGSGPVTLRGSGNLFTQPGVVLANSITVSNPDGARTSLGTDNATSSTLASYSGPVDLNGAVVLQAGNSGGTAFTGRITGTGDVSITSPNDIGRRVILDRPSGLPNAFVGDVYLHPGAYLQIGNGSDPGNRTIPDGSTLYFGEGSRLQISPGGTGTESIRAIKSATAKAGIVETISGSSEDLFELTIGVGDGSSTFSGIIRDSIGSAIQLRKVGTGTLTLGGANSYIGGTTIANGILRLSNGETIPNVGMITLSGGTLSTGETTGYSNHLGTLAVTANSTLALGTGSHALTFSGLENTGTGILTIQGWTYTTLGGPGSQGRIFINLEEQLPSNVNIINLPFLARVQFSGFSLGDAELIPTGNGYIYELVVTPEPSMLLLIATAAMPLAIRRRPSSRLHANSSI